MKSTFNYTGRPKNLPRPAAMKSWVAMMQRCYNAKASRFINYGGRGIKVCDRWHLFVNFYADMGERPEGRSLERVDPNYHYCPENCRWATAQEQAANTTTTSYLTVGGVKKRIIEWANDSGIGYGTLRKRIRMGWPTEELFLPLGSTFGKKKKGKPHSAEHTARIKAALLRYHQIKGGAQCRL